MSKITTAETFAVKAELIKFRQASNPRPQLSHTYQILSLFAHRTVAVELEI